MRPVYPNRCAAAARASRGHARAYTGEEKEGGENRKENEEGEEEEEDDLHEKDEEAWALKRLQKSSKTVPASDLSLS